MVGGHAGAIPALPVFRWYGIRSPDPAGDNVPAPSRRLPTDLKLAGWRLRFRRPPGEEQSGDTRYLASIEASQLCISCSESRISPIIKTTETQSPQRIHGILTL